MDNRTHTNAVESQRDEYYGRIRHEHLAPLWTRLKALVPNEPTPLGLAHRWGYDDLRPVIMESGTLITAAEAERRVLILENPGFTGDSRITNSLYAGLQLLLPGEVAPAHRHTQSALRFVMEGEGAYTAVDGERTTVREGDFVITPSWTWHHHGNDSDRPMVWLDGLDIPTVAFFNSTFREDHDAIEAEITRPSGDATARYGSGLLPVGHRRTTLNSPVFNYPYARTREALQALVKAGPPDPHQGYLMRYANPIDGGWAMPTIATMIRLLPGGFATQPYRSTDAMVFVAMEGRGSIRFGGHSELAFGPRDILTVPGWMPYSIAVETESVVFSFSDRVVQERLGIFRETIGWRRDSK
jgi:gentisate 1,2-dioxygenase